jgi:DNA-binding FrmR family transcriptional regulator
MESCEHCEKSGPGVNTDALKRLKRAQGQVNGIIRMVEDNKYCVDILTQIAAARAALDKAGMVILKNHIKNCVTDAIGQGDEEGAAIIEELMGVLEKR